MKKMNNKGFLMVEALIVSTFVVSVLIYFFVQFKKVDESFELSYSYNTVNGLYAVNNISMYLDNLYANDNDFKLLVERPNNNEQPVINASAPYYRVIYNRIDDENYTCISSQQYCEKLMKSLNIKRAILASGNLDSVLQFFKDVENDKFSNDEEEKDRMETYYNFFTEKMRDFIKHERSKELYSPDYKILVQFNDDTFASIDKVFEASYTES